MTYPRIDVVADMLVGIDDLDQVVKALARETVIRQIMTEIGEDRQTVIDLVDAMDSMGQEAVLSLTEGEPTTLREALSRYVDGLEKDIEVGDACGPVTIAADLSTLLNYPFPGDISTV